MKIFIFVLFTLLSANVSAGPYVDFGLGYIQSIPGESDVILTLNGNVIVQVNEKESIDLDSPFLTLRLGYRFENDNWTDNVHLEYNRFGLLDSETASVSSWRAFKRFESKGIRLIKGFYTDLGLGYVIDVPSKTKTKTEDQTAMTEIEGPDGSVSVVEVPVVLTATATATINLDSPFPMVRLGYRWKTSNVHLEYERIGTLFDSRESISTITVYKKWEWN